MEGSKAAVVMKGEFTGQDRIVASAVYLSVGVVGLFLYTSGLRDLGRRLGFPSVTFYRNLYVANMSMTVCSLFAGYSAYMGKWQFGDTGCQVYATVSFVGGMAAILMTSFLVADAYMAVCWKRAYERVSDGLVQVVVVMGWMIAGVWAISPLIGYSSYSLEPVGVTCEISWLRTDSNHVTFLTLLVGFGFTLPFGAASFLLFLSWCGREENNDHESSILQASTFHLISSLVAWTPYAVICLLPFFIENPPLPLPPLMIIAPSMIVKGIISIQPFILSYCLRAVDRKVRLD